MAKQAVQLNAAVGLRWGYSPVANQAQDVASVIGLFDRVLSSVGGTSDIPGTWPTDPYTLITGLADLIRAFQARHKLPVIDSVIDPYGKTLKLLNQLAVDATNSLFIGETPGFETNNISASVDFADPASLPGSKPLVAVTAQVNYSRRLVGVLGCSIKWFGVLLPSHVDFTTDTVQPLIFFTPSPLQGKYYDGDYESFKTWTKLWNGYTEKIGGLMCAAGVKQVLVIPFYRTRQRFDLGDFLLQWKDIVSMVVTAAVSDIHPYALGAPFAFDSIVTCNFSNGAAPHRNFQEQGAGVGNATSVLFDLDGRASYEGANWSPAGGIAYRNQTPGPVNPTANTFYVGGRFANFGAEHVTMAHRSCNRFLLAHGLSQFSW